MVEVSDTSWLTDGVDVDDILPEPDCDASRVSDDVRDTAAVSEPVCDAELVSSVGVRVLLSAVDPVVVPDAELLCVTISVLLEIVMDVLHVILPDAHVLSHSPRHHMQPLF